MIADLTTRLRAYETHMEAMDISQIRRRICARYGCLAMNTCKMPPLGSIFKTDPDAAAAQIRLALNLIRVYAITSRPFIPDAAASLMAAMGSDDWSWPEDLDAALGTLPAGHAFTVPDVLFAKITDDQREDWESRFAGGALGRKSPDAGQKTARNPVDTRGRASRRQVQEFAGKVCSHHLSGAGENDMAKPTTIKIRLNSTAGTGHFYVTKKKRPHHDREDDRAQIRPRSAQACRIQGRQDQVILPPHFGSVDDRAPKARFFSLRGWGAPLA